MATARTPEGLRNDPHAPHNRGERNSLLDQCGLRANEEVLLWADWNRRRRRGCVSKVEGGEMLAMAWRLSGDDQHDDATEREDVGRLALSRHLRSFQIKGIGSVIQSFDIWSGAGFGSFDCADASGQRAEEL